MDKKEFRKKMKSVRSAVSDRPHITKKLASSLLSLDDIMKAQTIFCYISFRDEPGTHEIIRALIDMGKTVCVPRTYDDGTMEAVKIDSFEGLRRGGLGVLEPDSGDIVEKSNIDVVIMPGLCYDKMGFRLGYGKGYYDRYLTDFQGLKIGLCFDECMVDDVLREPHDVAADMVITQSRVLHTV